MTRPDWDIYYLRMAAVVATRGTCVRRQVGAVLVNGRHQVIATGYNGRARGLEHCDSKPCAAAQACSGTNLDGCEAVHAEANALMQCRDVYDVATAYVTVSPCVGCVKLLLNTGCMRIVFAERYAHDETARKLWEPDGHLLLSTPARWWTHYPLST